MHRFLQAQQIFLAAPVAEHFGRRAMPEETIEMRAHVGADQAGVGLDHFGQQFRMSVGEAVIDRCASLRLSSSQVSKKASTGAFSVRRAISCDVLVFEFFEIRFFEMLEHHAVPTMPFGKFQFALAGDALLFEFFADLFVSELGLEIAASS